MDKYEFNIKVEQIKKMVNKNDYETAMKIADTIDWRRVRNTNLLSMVALVYEKNEDYQEAKEILLQAYERAPIGKRLLYKLAELAVKEGNIEEAESYYKEFGDLASEDPRQQLLRYMILKAKGAPAQQLIHSLESYTSVELDEKWLYELAELYSLAGMQERCVETCDRIMLMFGLGKYVEKAMDLKVQYAPLTNYQMDLIENRDKYEARLRAVEQEYGTGKKVSVQLKPDTDYYQEASETDEYPDMVYEESVEEDYEASMQEAEVQESLAREMSKITYNEPAVQEEPAVEHTRILEDIRRVGRDIPVIPRSRESYIPEVEEEQELYSEPVIEEEEPQEFDHKVYQIPSAATAEQDEDVTLEPEESYVYDEEQYSNYYEGEESAVYQPDTSGYHFPQDEEEELDFENQYAEEEEEDLQEPPVRNHLMIEARTPEKGLQLAVDALKQIHRESGVNNPVAKITGSKLSKRGIFASADKLSGKDLVIEDAGDLTPEALLELNQLMERDSSGMIVVLIDNPKQMETLHQEHPDLASKFECIGSGEGIFAPEPVPGNPVREDRSAVYNRESHYDRSVEYQKPEYDYSDSYNQPADYQEDDFYDESSDEPADEPVYRQQGAPEYTGEEMDIDEFAQYACRYANEIDCNITGKSMLALYERIEIMEEDGVPLNRENAENLIEEAADRAEKPSMGKRIKGLFSTKYDKDGLLILKEEHFIY
ncbi:tetratricopeptide repeat protein [Clostridium boliviensis]|uniref:Tetratricopeptide repeat protein n=1 Tax=Clostridium boliviensis TaxID=318465 RepID=A0ABU4GH76_9CLOT|nr:tetratricopeptide repeat protein [Clostridium boliviensis]MDW2796975.1 tetratricopeptide repeat protein [Clostridium boliviensis]